MSLPTGKPHRVLIAQGKTLAIKTLEDLGHMFTDPPPVQAQPSSSRVPAGPTLGSVDPMRAGALLCVLIYPKHWNSAQHVVGAEE